MVSICTFPVVSNRDILSLFCVKEPDINEKTICDLLIKLHVEYGSYV